MKYWRGYLTAGVLGFFSWALLQFAKSHTQLIDMVYPYVTRMVQGSLAQWTGGVDYILWQVLLTLFVVVVLATVVLMIVFRWNPIQWFGWVLAALSVVLLLNTGLYGLNDYAGPVAEDLKLEVTDYTVDELKAAAAYYRDLAGDLASQVDRDANGDVVYPDFATLADMAADGFQNMTYEQHVAIFYGTAINAEDETHWTQWEALPVKELGWTDYFTSIGVDAIHMPLTGEVAVNPQIPAVGQPFVMCREIARRLAIANDGDAEFAAYLACCANPSLEFQYSGQLMAYRSCLEALESMPGQAAAAALADLKTGEEKQLRHDLDQYDLFFVLNEDSQRVERLEQLQNLLDDVSYHVRDFLGVEKLRVETDTMYDLLVSWHIQEVVLPNQLPDEDAPKFDPYDEDYVSGVTDIEGNMIVTDPTDTTGEPQA